MIYPRTTDTFIKNDWEKEIVVIKRNCPDYFLNLYSKKEIEVFWVVVVVVVVDIDVKIHEKKKE